MSDLCADCPLNARSADADDYTGFYETPTPADEGAREAWERPDRFKDPEGWKAYIVNRNVLASHGTIWLADRVFALTTELAEARRERDEAVRLDSEALGIDGIAPIVGMQCGDEHCERGYQLLMAKIRVIFRASETSNKQLRAQLARANAVIERVGALHTKGLDVYEEEAVCNLCRTVDGMKELWPCPTARTILEGNGA